MFRENLTFGVVGVSDQTQPLPTNTVNVWYLWYSDPEKCDGCFRQHSGAHCMRISFVDEEASWMIAQHYAGYNSQDQCGHQGIISLLQVRFIASYRTNCEHRQEHLGPQSWLGELVLILGTQFSDR